MKPITIRVTPDSLKRAEIILSSLPIDGTIELLIRDFKKPSSHAQRKLMFGYRLQEIADQAWVKGLQHSKIVWHEYFKEKFLPSDFTEGETLDGYVKWIELPNGRLRMVGSTTKLTTRGQVNYMTQVEEFAASELGVQFSADERMFP